MAYDDSKHHNRRMIVIADTGGISVPGTAASDTVLVRFVVLDSISVDRARMVAMTGGTAVGPTVAIQKSLGGTGAGATFASQAFGTAANNTVYALTVTETTFVAGDHILITNVAGTSAATPKANWSLGFKETFPVP